MLGIVSAHLMLMPNASINGLGVIVRCKRQGFIGEIKLVSLNCWPVPINMVVFREVYRLGCIVSVDRCVMAVSNF